MRTANIIGTTGLTGHFLLNQILEDEHFETVRVFTRRPTGTKHQKLEEHIINFDSPDEWKHLVQGDVLFSTLGTTLKKAGSKENQFKVDFQYQYEFAKAAAENKVPVYVLVSAPGANPSSIFFYSKIKGKLEQKVIDLDFKSIHILHPSILEGDRKENRFFESLGIRFMKLVNKLGLLKSYRPIHGKTLARAMLEASFKTYTVMRIYEPYRLFIMADQYLDRKRKGNTEG
ncbi:NADH-quinone oxidoreductase subunit F [Cytophagaceae bacterium ABcell3]|nr:NADH-quinone oxidoreductase subunit F [Cytophagaceae bacterium ABcell3]